MPPERAVREVLRDVLDRQGRNAQAELARKLDVDPDMVSRWVGRGKTTTAIKADDVPRIARALGMTISELYGVDEEHTARRAETDIVLSTGGGKTEALVIQVRYATGDAPRLAVNGVDMDLGRLIQGSYRRQTSVREIRDFATDWPTMAEDERHYWRSLAAEIRQEDEREAST